MKSFTLIAVVVSLTTASVEHREKLITGVVRQGGDSLQKTWTNTPGVYGHTLGGTGTVYPTGYYPYITPYIPVSNEVTEAFTARRASPFTTAGSKIVFAEGVTQVGTGWNTATSEFLAPTTGVYFFTFAAMSDHNTHFRVSLRHNGAEVVNAYGDATGYQMGSQSAVLYLNAGDSVYLQLEEGRLYDATSTRAYTTFTGFKVL
ncbi:complement C1q tumor necrosis factor-related protein 3 isoform X2 [Cherax quadricarinatus]|uniref:complement C1q tumor necrosis factor-related protein 3 isoform X2 n=1 Tax=Cherax quadricarinatus TaxID=27406 RepID=UPI002378041D|nr:complement C1q tumor necrosis factor-related protein 3-like isoform X2 [Cherax quadricarinatus]